MRLLLDTHALLWWWADDPQLTSRARSALEDKGNAVFVSAAAAWEIATKQRIGKLPSWPLPAGGFDALALTDGFSPCLFPRLTPGMPAAWPGRTGIRSTA